MNIGHDECIFRKYIFSTEAWTGPDGETLLIPKDECIGIIIYDFHSREFVFGFAWDDISNADTKRINYLRSYKAYMDKDASKLLRNGVALKKDLSRGGGVLLWCFLSTGIPKINKDIGSMITLF